MASLVESGEEKITQVVSHQVVAQMLLQAKVSEQGLGDRSAPDAEVSAVAGVLSASRGDRPAGAATGMWPSCPRAQHAASAASGTPTCA